MVWTFDLILVIVDLFWVYPVMIVIRTCSDPVGFINMQVLPKIDTCFVLDKIYNDGLPEFMIWTYTIVSDLSSVELSSYSVKILYRFTLGSFNY